MTQSSGKKYKFFKRLIVTLLSVFIAILIIITIVFNFYKDDIGRELLLQVNKIQKGELVFDDVSFNPLVSFPDVSIALETVSFYENPAINRINDSLPIVELKKLYVTFDVIDLIKGNINLSQILLENGRFNFITYADSSLNLINALNLESDTLQNDNDTLSGQSMELEINLHKIILKNIGVSYSNVPKNNNSEYSIQSLNASLNYLPNSIMCFINSDINVDKKILLGGLALNNKPINIETSVAYDRSLQEITIEPSELSFDRANFAIGGNIILSDDGFIDLQITGNDKDFSILNLFLTNTGVKNIKQGDLYFKGTVKGKLFDGIPLVECSFGMEDVYIEIPNTDHSINKLSLKGNFRSGINKNLSKAHLNVENLTAQLPGGNLNCTFSVRDFQTPYFDVQYQMEADITGFEKVFNLGILDSLRGLIAIDTDFRGKYDPVTSQVIEEKDNSVIRFDGVSFVLPGVTQIQNTNGTLRFDADTLLFEDFGLEIGRSDFNINGSITNIFYLLFDVEKDIDGSLDIISKTYDLPDFFKYDQRVGSSFPYRIKNIDLGVKVSTSTFNLSNFTSTPKIVFDIQNLDAEIEDFLPPIRINSGLFTLEENDSPLNLDFDDFDIEIAGSKLLADVVFNSPRHDPDWLNVDVNSKNLNLRKAFIHWFDDSTLNTLNGNLDGIMKLDLVLSMDTIVFDKLDFTLENLNFVNSTDTINIDRLVINAMTIDYKTSSEINVFESLMAEINLTIRKFNSRDFKVNDLDYSIEIKDGIYFVQPNTNQFFGSSGEGYIILMPFEEKPAFEINYAVEQFDAAAMFSSFMEDTIITGKMNLDLAIKFNGTKWEEIGKSLDGKLLVYGEDLTFHGLDLDKFIDRFKRSQNFTLADVGAVMLMGPAGILVTKGSDFASIVVLNPGESCKVVGLSSDWVIDDGLVTLADVAFTTTENRMAATGWIDLNSDSLNVQVALLNEKGCSLYSQEISGGLEEPEMSKVKVMKSIFAPITNLVKGECDVFYDGKVKQPVEKK